MPPAFYPSMSLKQKIYAWDNLFPFDLWWRRKYKVAFGSVEHKSMKMSFVVFDYEENRLLDEEIEKQDPEEFQRRRVTKKVKGEDMENWIGGSMTKQEIDKAFEDFDPVKYAEIEKERKQKKDA
jgi:hypothetical protein